MDENAFPEVRDNDLYVSPDGDNSWSGKLADPHADETDGPFRTIERAQREIRDRKDSATLGDGVTVWLRGGRYPREEPIRFTPEDTAPVTYSAYPGETPVIDGGRQLTDWERTEVNGVTAWKTTVPEVAAGDWYFKQLFVDGERRTRPRLPDVGDLELLDEEDFYWIADLPEFDIGEDPQSREYGYEFIAEDGDIEEWRNIADVDVIALRLWFEERLRISDVDTETNRVELARRGVDKGPLIDERRESYARYYVENVFEALSDSGEWYLDRQTGECYYVPFEGERMDDVEIYAPAPSLKQLVQLEGRPAQNDYVEFISFEGITLRHSAWEFPRMGTASAQAGFNLEGAITLEGTRNCSFEDCTFTHLGLYAIEIRQGCTGVRIVGNELTDLGGGGIKMNGFSRGNLDAIRQNDPPEEYGPGYSYPKHEWYEHRTGNNRVTDNNIHSGGRVFHCTVGILAMHTFGNRISHNHIHDFFYSGISCGWTWGYGESEERDNRIEYNHINDLGKGLLSDMGGIYTLGVQSGTTIRGNHIHDVDAWNYGGWAIYPDEGSSHLVIEKNLCHDTNRQAFNQHFGRENIVRNNIFAFGGESQIRLSRAEDHVSYTFERNIVVTDAQPIFSGGYGWGLEPGHIISDLNVFWDINDHQLSFGRPTDTADYGGTLETEALDYEAWQERGFDTHSTVADPKFSDVDAREFALDVNSPAFDLGFEPLDLSLVGPRSTKNS